MILVRGISLYRYSASLRHDDYQEYKPNLVNHDYRQKENQQLEQLQKREILLSKYKSK